METSTKNTYLFEIKGFTAIQIGIYLLISGFLTKQIIDGFITDGNTMGMLSVQLIEIIVLFLILTFFFLAIGAIYFKNKRVANKKLQSLWSVKNKLLVAKFLFGFLMVFSILFVMSQKGLVNQITSSFLIGFGAITHILNESKNKFLLAISILCLILAMVSYLIPSYWYPSILLIGSGFVVKGVVKG